MVCGFSPFPLPRHLLPLVFAMSRYWDPVSFVLMVKTKLLHFAASLKYRRDIDCGIREPQTYWKKTGAACRIVRHGHRPYSSSG